MGQDGILRGGCQSPLSLYYAKLNSFSNQVRLLAYALRTTKYGWFANSAENPGCKVAASGLCFTST